MVGCVLSGFLTTAAILAEQAPAAAMPTMAPLEKASKWDGMATARNARPAQGKALPVMSLQSMAIY